jgi:DNA-directed RNA polymerase subunit H (RpoH/RPB5)
VRSELARERSEGANVETMGLVIVMVGDVGDVAPKDAMEGIELLPGQVEFFVASDFYSFKPGHEKCPLRFDILNEKETRSVVSRYVGKDGDVTKFPTIGKTDELARYYGLRAGEMARIISDMTHPPSVRYDVCVDRSS